MFLHRLQQRRLGLRRRAVDLVGEDHVGEDRTTHEGEAAAAVAVVLQDLGAGDIRRHEVGRELDAREPQVENLRDRLHEQRLGEARCAGDQAVPAGEEGEQDLLDDVALADDHLAQLGLDAGAAGEQTLGGIALRG